MIRRPLTSIGLKQVDVDHMEACLQRRSKNPETNENEVSPNVQRSGSVEAPLRMITRSSGERAFASPRSTSTTAEVGGLSTQQDSATTPASPMSNSETTANTSP
ncbi:hypothetical protein M3Y98_01140500 [Aphelenchoides besseyi]|nr:hypothetical protein M3Y98_01140500 [Aphelenchoides besseyi]KAI6210680.1 hypothetical protein M3Y96_00353500 [Aphelenchoides besseyi]